MTRGGEIDPERYLADLRSAVEDRTLPHTPLETEYGTVMGVAEIQTLDQYNAPESMAHVLITLTLTEERKIALEYHFRHRILGREGVHSPWPDGDDPLCANYLIDDDEVISRWPGSDGRTAMPIGDVLVPPWRARGRAADHSRHMGDILGLLRQAPHEHDLFHPANIDARRIALDTVAGGHVIVDRAAQVALQGLREL